MDTELLGFAAAALTTGAFVPQADQDDQVAQHQLASRWPCT
jgi:hypothetical protein